MKVIGRFLRILPLYIFVMAFTNLVVPSFGDGPLWHTTDEVLNLDCKDYWWTNFLFLNNMIPFNRGNDCLLQTWYLAADMQFFLFSIFLIILYLKYSKTYAWITIGLLCLFSLILRLVLSDSNYVMISFLNSKQGFDNTRATYIKAYTKCSPYFFGLLSGFIFYQYKTKKQDD